MFLTVWVNRPFYSVFHYINNINKLLTNSSVNSAQPFSFASFFSGINIPSSLFLEMQFIFTHVTYLFLSAIEKNNLSGMKFCYNSDKARGLVLYRLTEKTAYSLKSHFILLFIRIDLKNRISVICYARQTRAVWRQGDKRTVDYVR